jgi:hypothetical protein
MQKKTCMKKSFEVNLSIINILRNIQLLQRLVTFYKVTIAVFCSKIDIAYLILRELFTIVIKTGLGENFYYVELVVSVVSSVLSVLSVVSSVLSLPNTSKKLSGLFFARFLA